MGKYIANGDVLPVALIIGKSECLGIQNMQEAFEASPVLNIGKTILTNTSQVAGIPLLNELGLPFCEAINLLFLLKTGINRTASVAFLQRLYHVGEGKGSIVLFHIAAKKEEKTRL